MGADDGGGIDNDRVKTTFNSFLNSPFSQRLGTIIGRFPGGQSRLPSFINYLILRFCGESVNGTEVNQSGQKRKMSPLIPRMFLVIFFLSFSIPTIRLTAETAGGIELTSPELVSYRCRLKDSQTVRWEGSRLMERSPPGPPDRYTVSYREDGIFENESRREDRLIQTDFELIDGRLRTLSSRSTNRDDGGRIVRTIQTTFNYPAKIVRTRTVIGPDGPAETDNFDLETGMINGREIWILLRGFPYPGLEGESGNIEFKILTDKPASYSIRIRYDGMEDVTTPAGTFSCYRLRMVPDLGILSWVGELFAPTIFLWFTVETPHYWIRYTGPESGPGTPEVNIEMVEARWGGGLRTNSGLKP